MKIIFRADQLYPGTAEPGQARIPRPFRDGEPTRFPSHRLSPSSKSPSGRATVSAARLTHCHHVSAGKGWENEPDGRVTDRDEAL